MRIFDTVWLSSVRATGLAKVTPTSESAAVRARELAERAREERNAVRLDA